MTNKLSLTFILTSLLLAIWLYGRAPDACAAWELLPGTEDMGVGIIETDEHRLYAAASQGVYASLDNGYTWRYAELAHGHERLYIIAIGIGPNAVYAGTHNHGVYRSDSHGKTWKPKRKGIRIFDLDEPDREPYYAEVKQILVTRSGTVIAVGYHSGSHTSANRGETWRDITREWKYQPTPESYERFIGAGIWSMTEFDGYLWIAHSVTDMFRSSDNGETWEIIRAFEPGRVTDWEVLNDRLYVSGRAGFGRWNEMQGEWAYLTEGLPFGRYPPHLTNLAVNRGRIFAGLSEHGVYMFDERSETWIPAGLDGLTVSSLISHQSDLYAVAMDRNWDSLGIYRASISIVQPYGKAAVTWGAVKQRVR